MIRNSGWLVTAVLLSGCAGPRIIYECAALPMPEPAPLPVVDSSRFIDLSGKEEPAELRGKLPAIPMVCVDDRGYESLAIRDAMRRGHAEELRAIIRAHNESLSR